MEQLASWFQEEGLWFFGQRKNMGLVFEYANPDLAIGVQNAAKDAVGDAEALVNLFGKGFGNRVAHPQIMDYQVALGVSVRVNHMGELSVPADWHHARIF